MRDNRQTNEVDPSEIKISIITVNLNNASGLEQTLNSIFTQKDVSFENIESIIIDGGSSDSSKVVIESYSSKISYYISEKDRGVYDAMNKGIRLAKGSYLWFLNSGDYLFNQHSLCKFIQAINKSEKFDLIYSDIYLSKQNKLTKKIQPSDIPFAYLINRMINHQSYILKSNFFLLENNFTLNYKLISDWIFLFELFKTHTINTHKIELPLVVYDNEGISISSGSLWLDERARYLKSVYSDWELESLHQLARLNSKKYYGNLVRSLDSPGRSKILSNLLRFMYFFSTPRS